MDTGGLSRAGLYYHTVRHLRPVQWRYRLYYALRARWRRMRNHAYPVELEPPHVARLKLLPSISAPDAWLGPRRFRFLNLEHSFEDRIDWDFEGYGKLWTYNLNYFDFLHQRRMNPEAGLRLIRDLMEQLGGARNALEPYPISLRMINWVKFLVRHGIDHPPIQRSLYAQYRVLQDNLEYHILGNHLLENAFALLFGAYYFADEAYYPKVKRLLTRELEEQVLEDGAHFERSPMYHQIILFRLLDAFNLARENPERDEGLAAYLGEKAAAMLGWLDHMTLSEDRIPLFNDSAYGIAPTTGALWAYAGRLGLEAAGRPLSDSGYRRFDGEKYTLIADVGDIGPEYIPGHAHCDTLSFVMEVGGKSWIVDTGVSTYEKNARRQAERGTASHNVVQVDALEQSEVWDGFRVARRAHVLVRQDGKNLLEAEHDGYARHGYTHRRVFRPEPGGVLIEDVVDGHPEGKVLAYFHFAPGTELILDGNQTKTPLGTLTFSGHLNIEKKTFAYAPQFNRTVEAPLLVVHIRDGLRTKMQPTP